MDYQIYFENPKARAQYDCLSGKIRTKVDEAFEMLKENPFRDERLTGNVLKGSWSFHVEKNFMIVHKVEEDKIVVRALGDHQTAYTELERYLRKSR